MASFNRLMLVTVVVSAAGIGVPSVESETTAAELSPRLTARRVDNLLESELFAHREDDAPLPADVVDDATYLRRVTLDVVGRPPSPEELTAFVLDPSPEKRRDVVRRLLDDEQFGLNWGRYWRDVILYRSTDQRAQIVSASVTQFLADQLNSGAGWDNIARAFVTARGNVTEEGSTALIMAQMASAESVAAETSRVFLGVQIQCAQCHDHPTDRWKREQFHQLAAFFPRIQVRPVRVEGKRRGFEVASRDNVRNGRRPGAAARNRNIEHYMPDLDDPSAKGTLMQPVFFATGELLEAGTRDADRRGALADWMTSADNPWFAKAMVNRTWSELVGEGFYEPVDDMGPDRDCAAPKALDMLARQFAAHDYDVKWLFRAITATDAYQRESRPRRNSDETPFLAGCPQRLRGDQLYTALTAALGVDQLGGARRPRPRVVDAPSARRGPQQQFNQQFGYDPSLPREEVTGSIPQALALMNSPQINAAINGSGRNTALGRLLADVDDDEEVAVELYVRCLAREPSSAELEKCLAYVTEVGDRREGFEDILWALVNSAEFLHRK